MPRTTKAERETRRQTVEQRVATVLAECPGINRHLAIAVAAEDRMWNGDGADWRWMVTNTPVAACQLSCCDK